MPVQETFLFRAQRQGWTLIFSSVYRNTRGFTSHSLYATMAWCASTRSSYSLPLVFGIT